MSESIALVLETNNLRHGNASGAVAALTRLFEHLADQRFSLARLQEIVVTHDGLDASTRDALASVLKRPIHWLSIDPETTYYEAKNRGFLATKSDVVVFADADCWPERNWLSALLSPFSSADVRVVAGRTRYRNDALGRAVSLLDFLYVERADESGARSTKNFYANNVAFRREVFERHHYAESEQFFRGHCQSLGMRLDRAGVRIVFQDDAVTEHRFPDELHELLTLRLYRGRDLRMLAPAIVSHAGFPLGTFSATVATWMGRQVIAAADLRKREPKRATRWLIGSLALGVASIDAVGAILGDRTGASKHVTLDYQTDRDGFTKRDAAPSTVATSASH
jgi:hypothetical protein